MQQPSAGGATPIGSVLAIVGGALLAIGSFLVWVTLSGGGFDESTTGVDGSDGWITFAAGLVAILAGFLAIRSGRRAIAVVVILAGLVGGGLGVYDALTVRDSIAEELAPQLGVSVEEARAGVDLLVDGGQLEISMGIGLILVLAGGALALIGGLLMLARRKEQAGAEPAQAPVGMAVAPSPAAPIQETGGAPPPPPPSP